jgi:multisubunit Na+/H+ antiporter MnhE subunit
MLNIFNLFLFLLALWILFMIAAGNISWLYIMLGVMSAALVSFGSYRLKLIEKDSELLYMSFGFYRHFSKIFFKNSFAAIKLVFILAFRREPIRPVVYVIKFDEKNKFNPALLMTSFSMSAGLLCIGTKDDNILVHAIDSEYFKNFDVLKTILALRNINDDNLV